MSPDIKQERTGGVKKMTAQNLASHAIVYLTLTLTIFHQSQLHLNFYVYLTVTLLSRGNAPSSPDLTATQQVMALRSKYVYMPRSMGGSYVEYPPPH